MKKTLVTIVSVAALALLGGCAEKRSCETKKPAPVAKPAPCPTPAAPVVKAPAPAPAPVVVEKEVIEEVEPVIIEDEKTRAVQ